MPTPRKTSTSPRRRPVTRKRRTAAAAPSTGRRPWLVVLAVAGGCLLLAAAWLAGWSCLSWEGEERWIRIPGGATEEQVADSLVSGLGEGYGTRVNTLRRLMGGSTPVAEGAYLVSPGRRALSLARAMTRGHQTPVRVTIAGTRTLEGVAARLASRLELSEADFLAACDSVLPAAGFTSPEQYPAAFLPDTYEFYWNIDPGTLVKRLLAERNDFWTPERRQQASALGLDPVGVATIASIVEEETAKPDERPRVARLYLNRLDRDMKLQADPTVKFALGDFALRRINQAHLTVDSPYNTYRVAGLPPGPIRVVERRSLLDVLEAPAHDYIYMCARSDFSGYHDFASDYATHLANARRYQAELDRRNIR